jgi:hypothetical protein
VGDDGTLSDDEHRLELSTFTGIMCREDARRLRVFHGAKKRRLRDRPIGTDVAERQDNDTRNRVGEFKRGQGRSVQIARQFRSNRRFG